MKKIIFLAIVCFFSDYGYGFAQAKVAWISSELRTSEKIILNTAIDFRPIQVELKNTSCKTTIVKKELEIYAPTHIFKSDLIIDNTGKQTTKIKNYLLLPEETESVDNRSESLLDTLLDFSTEDLSMKNPLFKEKLLRNGLTELLNLFNVSFNENENRIANIRLNAEKKKYYSMLNFNLKVSRLIKISLEKLTYKDSVIYDSVMKEIANNVDRIERVNSPLNFNIYYSIIRYSANRNGNKSKNYWEFYNDADPNLKNKPFFKKYLLTQLNSIYTSRPEVLTEYVNKAAKFGLSQIELDDFLRTIKTGQSKQALNKNLLLNLYGLPVFENTYGKKTSFEEIIKKNPNKYILLDFWASWCLPCRDEAPELFKLKSQFEKISFVQVSIDNETNITAWKKAIVDSNAPKSIQQVRLFNAKTSEIVKRLNLSTIPRYILINSSGEIIYDELPRPTDVKLKNILDSIPQN